MQFIKVTKKIRSVHIIISIFIISALIVNMSGNYLMTSVNGRIKLKKRFEYLMQNWPQITKTPDQTNLFIGTSVYQYFLDPRIYDEALKTNGISMNSYNLSFQGNIGIGLRSYMNRLKSECEKENIKFDSVFFEIIPSAENKKFYRSHRNMIDIGNPDIFMNRSTWAKLFLTDPISAIYLSFVNKVRPMDWNYLIGSYLATQKFRPRTVRFAGIANFWSLPQFYEEPEWNIKTAGMVNWNRPRSSHEFDETMRSIHTPEQWGLFLKEYINGNTISKDFAYEENLIDFYIQSINIAKSFSKNVYILKLPTAPTFQKLVDEYVNEEYMIHKVRKETGVQIIDYTQVGNFTDNDFADPMHLKNETMNFYVRRLANDMSVIKKSTANFK